MSNCLKALAFSLITHGLAAVALAFWLSHTQAIELPSLDLSAVELFHDFSKFVFGKCFYCAHSSCDDLTVASV